jgi:hypothetical protein
MNIQLVNLGRGVDSGNGDSLPESFTKINGNFTSVIDASTARRRRSHIIK